MRRLDRCMGTLVLMALCLGLCDGCATNRDHGVLPRTGELYMSTRAFNEHNGKGFGYLAFMTWPTVIGPIVFIPTGVAVGLLDQCVFSPIWDTLCIPADLTVPVIEMRIVDSAGRPVRKVEVDHRYRTDENGRVKFKVLRRRGNPVRITVDFAGGAFHPFQSFEVPWNTPGRDYVLLTTEELARQKKEQERQQAENRLAEQRRQEEQRQRDRERDYPHVYLQEVLEGPLRKLEQTDLGLASTNSPRFHALSRATGESWNAMPPENLVYMFEQIERHPDAASGCASLYASDYISEEWRERNRRFAVRLAEEGGSVQPLMAIIERRFDNSDDFLRKVFEDPKLRYCRQRKDLERSVARGRLLARYCSYPTRDALLKAQEKRCWNCLDLDLGGARYTRVTLKLGADSPSLALLFYDAEGKLYDRFVSFHASRDGRFERKWGTSVGDARRNYAPRALAKVRVPAADMCFDGCTMSEVAQRLSRVSKDFVDHDLPHRFRGVNFYCENDEVAKRRVPETFGSAGEGTGGRSEGDVSLWNVFTNACHLTGCGYNVIDRDVFIGTK